jgi:hypothetical protein
VTGSRARPATLERDARSRSSLAPHGKRIAEGRVRAIARGLQRDARSRFSLVPHRKRAPEGLASAEFAQTFSTRTRVFLAFLFGLGAVHNDHIGGLTDVIPPARLCCVWRLDSPLVTSHARFSKT